MTGPRAGERPVLLLATTNPGKLREIRDLLHGVPYDVRSLEGMADIAAPEETGTTFEANAALKAHAAAQAAKLPALADDSGVAVTALNGDPGIYSARWAGPNKDFSLAMQRVHDALGDTKDRSAAFVSVLAVAWPDGHLESFAGKIDGTLVWPPRGTRGFGYDPMFVPTGGTQTFGEMEPAAKHAISHRAVAFRKLVAALLEP